MSFDLHSSFTTLICFWYQVKDSDKFFDDFILNIFSSVLFFSNIIFVGSEIILLLKFTKFAPFSMLLRNNSFSSIIGDYRWETIRSETGKAKEF